MHQTPLETRNLPDRGPLPSAPQGTTMATLLQGAVQDPADPGFTHLGNLRVENGVYPEFVRAHQHMAGAPEAVSVLHALRQAHPPVSVVPINDGDDAYDPATRTVEWDPRAPLINTDGTRQTAALGLVHEEVHAYHHLTNPARFDAESRQANKRYDDADEQRTIVGPETRMATALHEGTRRDHMGITYHSHDCLSLDTVAELDNRPFEAKLNSQIRELAAHGYPTLRPTDPVKHPVIAWDGKQHAGSIVHVDSQTVAQNTGRAYVRYDVQNDLHGVMPPQNVPSVEIDRHGNVRVPPQQQLGR